MNCPACHSLCVHRSRRRGILESALLAALFMNKFRKLGFIEYTGKIKVKKSLLTVVLHE